MRFSWLIVLFGAEVAFSNQNMEHYEAESQSFNISNHMKRTVTILLLKEIVNNFRSGNQPETSENLANKYGMSVRLVREILYELLEANIISETVTKNVKENAYQPAQDIQKLTISYVFNLLDKSGQDNISIEDIKGFESMKKSIDNLMEEIHKSKNNKLIYELG